MPSWSQPSPEQVGPAAEAGPAGVEQQIMRRRFVEALRRAEIVSLISAATDEAELAQALTEELCEVYDAEVAVLAVLGEDGEWSLLSTVGLHRADRDRILGAPELSHAAESQRAATERGDNLLGIGGRASLLSSYRSSGGDRVVIGAVRMYPQGFDEPEAALLEAVAVAAGQGLERLWARAERDELIARLKASVIGTAEALANALEAKDTYTASHASEVADLAVTVGRALGLEEAALEDLRYGAIFHDIGKIAIPDAILNKPGPLDEDERETMQRHPEIGEQILKPIPYLSDAVRSMVRHDHEHWDGGGYPDGLSAERIPLGARVILVVDSYHAMISDRPYRKAMPEEEALAELARHAGRQFDPEVVAAVLRIVA